MSPRIPVTPIDTSEIDTYDRETDVLVIGYGCAGAAAALEADAAGAQVIATRAPERWWRIVDFVGRRGVPRRRHPDPGGVRVHRHRRGHGEVPARCTRPGRRSGEGGPVQPRERRALPVARGPWGAVQAVAVGISYLPTWVPPTDDGLMWMGENAYPFYEIATPAPRGHRVTSEGFGGKVLMAVLCEAVEESAVAVHTDTSVLRLIRNGDRVVGVVARHFGETVTYRARRGVVLTTGGFADNVEMLAQHAPQLVGLAVTSDGGDDGRGIVMAQAAGAAVKHMSAGQVGISLVPGMMVRGMIVDSLGRRFINEDVYPGLVGQATLFEHNLHVWVILAEEAYEEVPVDERWGVQPHFVAETLEELEREIGMPEGALQTTVGEYNRFAEHGEDPYFHKSARWLRPLQAPFAAIDVRRGVSPPEYGDNVGAGGAEVFTIGGLRTTVDGAVLDLGDEPIPGLFAAGV
ncbi:FAD-binding protein [Rhodococcus chondri]|uniref:FAD-binding protein n=1 Tax=Rhodococcus chondri TaxID=3065941 RepID=UPI002E7AE302|nr:FAD-binding protein [Rhodococcus sp. CC-R104]